MANESSKIMTADLHRVDKVETLNALYGHITESATEAIGITEAAKVELTAAAQRAISSIPYGLTLVAESDWDNQQTPYPVQDGRIYLVFPDAPAQQSQQENQQEGE